MYQVPGDCVKPDRDPFSDLTQELHVQKIKFNNAVCRCCEKMLC